MILVGTGEMYTRFGTISYPCELSRRNVTGNLEFVNIPAKFDKVFLLPVSQKGQIVTSKNCQKIVR